MNYLAAPCVPVDLTEQEALDACLKSIPEQPANKSVGKPRLGTCQGRLARVILLCSLPFYFERA